MNSDYDVILGIPFVTDVNPIIDWKLKHWKTLEMIIPEVCEDKTRQVSLNIVYLCRRSHATSSII